LYFDCTIDFSALAVDLAGAAAVGSGVEKHTTIPTAAIVATSRTSFIGMGKSPLPGPIRIAKDRHDMATERQKRGIFGRMPRK
jgi:hypothetical protein